jgi:DNA-binding NarL/FixJ family response regulator
MFGVDCNACNPNATESIGIQGVLLWKDIGTDSLMTLLSVAVSEDVIVISQDVARSTMVSFARDPQAGVIHDHLLTRDHVILRAMAEGMTRAEIASRLGVSIRSVDRATERLKDALGASDMFTLAVRATALGLIPTSRS